MSAIRKSFYYSPIRQGYDTNIWSTVYGTPALVVGGRFTVSSSAGVRGSVIHYADFVKGDIKFNINIPNSPIAGDVRYFGVANLNSSYIRFSITDTLNCETSDGTNTTVSSDIAWINDWTGANVDFGIRWEAGGAKFFIDGIQIYAISDNSVPYGPLSLYLYDKATLPMTVGDINVLGTQSLVINLKTADTVLFPSVSPSISKSPSKSPSVSPSISKSPSKSPSLSPSLSPSKSPSVSPSVSKSPSKSPSLSPSKSPSVSPSISKSPSKSPSVSPSISKSPSKSPSLSPSLSPSKSPSVSPSISKSPSKSPSVSPSISKSPSVSPSASPSSVY